MAHATVSEILTNVRMYNNLVTMHGRFTLRAYVEYYTHTHTESNVERARVCIKFVTGNARISITQSPIIGGCQHG